MSIFVSSRTEREMIRRCWNVLYLVLRFRGAPISLVHRALFHQGCTCFRVHHAENVENKGFCAMLVNTTSSELVTIRTVLLLNGGTPETEEELLNRSHFGQEPTFSPHFQLQLPPLLTEGDLSHKIEAKEDDASAYDQSFLWGLRLLYIYGTKNIIHRIFMRSRRILMLLS